MSKVDKQNIEKLQKLLGHKRGWPFSLDECQDVEAEQEVPVSIEALNIEVDTANDDQPDTQTSNIIYTVQMTPHIRDSDAGLVQHLDKLNKALNKYATGILINTNGSFTLTLNIPNDREILTLVKDLTEAIDSSKIVTVLSALDPITKQVINNVALTKPKLLQQVSADYAVALNSSKEYSLFSFEQSGYSTISISYNSVLNKRGCGC